MTYRERRLRKADRLQEWADKRRTRASAVFAQGEPMRSDWAFITQPGHIPERARLIAREDKAYASLQKASGMESRAEGIIAAADRAIYSDDHDACDQLRARIAMLEAERDRIKVVNKTIRAKGIHAALPELTEAEKIDLLRTMQLCPYHKVETKGYPSYHLTNLSGNISRQRKRLEQLEAVEAQRKLRT